MDEDTAAQPHVDRLPSAPFSEQSIRDAEFSLFYKDQMPRLVAFLLCHGVRLNQAADLAQDTMIELYRMWDTIDNPRAWVRTVASRKWWRQNKNDQEVPHPDVADGLASRLLPAGTEEIENRHSFLTVVRELPTRQRQVMAWTYDGYQPTEIAAMLGESPSTTRSALRSARDRLRKTYGTEQEV